jgi:glycosyltransferase involved in cell wall biosynthesis
MKNLRVCLISDTVYDMNGVSRFIQDFAKEALIQKCSFFVLTSTVKNALESIENIYNIPPYLKIKMPFYASLDLVLPNYFKIKRKLKELKPHIVHISTPGPVGLCALFAAKALNLPIVGIYHTDFPSYVYKNTQRRSIEKVTRGYLRWFYKDFYTIFSRSKAYESHIQNMLLPHNYSTITFKSGINIDAFHPSFKEDSIWEQYGICASAFKVLYVGRISVEKNIKKLFAIWEQLNMDNKVLILVGDCEFILNEAFCKTHNIVHLGRKQTKELSQLYASSDCFVFPSTTDTLGQVVMEAMASALPVIVTSKGGPCTFVHASCGFCLDIFNRHLWTKTLTQLYQNKSEAKTMGHNGFLFMQEHSVAKSFQDFWQITYQRYLSWAKNS